MEEAIARGVVDEEERELAYKEKICISVTKWYEIYSQVSIHMYMIEMISPFYI